MSTTKVPRLKQLTTKRRQWSDILFGKDPNSIRNQVDALLAELACFMMLNSTGDVVFSGNDGNWKVHSYAFGTIHRCLLYSLIRRIRLLTEARPEKRMKPKVQRRRKSRNKDVHSLPAILDDMRQHAPLLSRARIFSVEGLPYQPPATQESPIDHFWSTQRHETVDVLTGKRLTNRQPEDRIPKKWFGRRSRRLKARAAPVVKFGNKYVFHAATADSQREFPKKHMRVNLARIWKTVATICEIVNELGVDVLGGSIPEPLPYLSPCEPVWESGDIPVVDPDACNEFWDRIRGKMARWRGHRRSNQDFLGTGLAI